MALRTISQRPLATGKGHAAGSAASAAPAGNMKKAAERTSGSRASRSQILTLASVIEQQREAGEANDASAFHRADELFHAKLAEIAGYPGIWRLVLQVKTQVDRFRRLTLVLPHRMAAVIEEHEKVLRAIERSDPQAASAAMMAHLDSVLPAIQQIEAQAKLDTLAGNK